MLMPFLFIYGVIGIPLLVVWTAQFSLGEREGFMRYGFLLIVIWPLVALAFVTWAIAVSLRLAVTDVRTRLLSSPKPSPPDPPELPARDAISYRELEPFEQTSPKGRRAPR